MEILNTAEPKFLLVLVHKTALKIKPLLGSRGLSCMSRGAHQGFGDTPVLLVAATHGGAGPEIWVNPDELHSQLWVSVSGTLSSA